MRTVADGADGNVSHCRALIDELLLERLPPWCRRRVVRSLLTAAVFPLLKRDEAARWVARMREGSATTIMDALVAALRLELTVVGAEHIPRDGAIMIMANHPTGMVDGVAVYEALRDIRPDLCIFSNRDAIRLAPALAEVIVPVEWMLARRSQARMRETLLSCRQAIRDRRAILTFPAGGIARKSINQLRDLDWLPATIKLVNKHQVPILSLHIEARNSWLYYALEAIGDQVRDLVRFREIFEKQRRPFVLTFGEVLPPEACHGDPVRVTEDLQTFVEHKFARPVGQREVVAGWARP